MVVEGLDDLPEVPVQERFSPVEQVDPRLRIDQALLHQLFYRPSEKARIDKPSDGHMPGSGQTEGTFRIAYPANLENQFPKGIPFHLRLSSFHSGTGSLTGGKVFSKNINYFLGRLKPGPRGVPVT